MNLSKNHCCHVDQNRPSALAQQRLVKARFRRQPVRVIDALIGSLDLAALGFRQMGTYAYEAPGLYEQHEIALPKTVVWALGVCLNEKLNAGGHFHCLRWKQN